MAQFLQRGFYFGMAFLMISSCSPTERRDEEPSQTADRSQKSALPRTTDGASQRQPEAARPPKHPSEQRLQAEIQRLSDAFDGDLGIAVRDLKTGWTAQVNGSEMLPQQSVSKLWVAIAALDRVDQGQLNLSEEVTLRPQDLTVFYQPVRPLVLRGHGYTTTLEDLLVRAITRSDNTANDFLMRRIGGPDAVREVLRRKGLEDIRFGPGERLFQSEIAGLQWKQDYSVGRAFFQARDEVPPDRRRAAFEAYLDDPVDGVTPAAVVDALARLKQEGLLSPASTERLLSIMSQTRSGPRRLKGGLQPGWSIAHKTGTGQIFQGVQAGYNDVGLLTSPGGRAYAVAVLIGRTDQPVPARMTLMQGVTGAVIDYDAHRHSRAATLPD